MWYVLNRHSIVAATCDSEPNIEDLRRRGYEVIKSDRFLDLGWKVVLDGKGNIVEAIPPEESRSQEEQNYLEEGIGV